MGPAARLYDPSPIGGRKSEAVEKTQRGKTQQGNGRRPEREIIMTRKFKSLLEGEIPLSEIASSVGRGGTGEVDNRFPKGTSAKINKKS